MKLFTIIAKNFKIFFRSKVSAFIIFLGPLLLVSLIGMSFSNTQLPGLTVGTYAPNYNDFTNSIISKIEANKFQIKKFDSKDVCSVAVKRGDSAICLLFPENMDATNNEVTFVVDYSKMNLVWMVVDIFSNKVSERSTELRYSYTTDLLDKVVKTQEDLAKEKSNLESLKTLQIESEDTAKVAQSSLNEINPSTDIGASKMTQAKSSISTIASRLDSAKSSIVSAKSKVSGSSLSETERDAINADLVSAEARVNDAKIYVNGNSTTDSIASIVNEIDLALQSAKLQLEDIKKKRDNVKGEIISLQDSIGDSIKASEDLKTALESTMSRISSIKSSDAAQIVSPIKTKIEPVSTQETHFTYLFPTLIVLIIMITAVLLSSTLVMNEKKSKSVFRNYITPTSDWIFNLGTFFTAFFAILIQLFIFLLISWLFFATDIFSSFGQSLLILVLITSTFILLGMLIGYIFKSEETYVLASVTISALLLFLSSTVMPIESISDSVRQFASATPFVVSENLLRQAMFFKFGFVSLLPEIYVLLSYIIGFAGIIYLMHKLFRFHISLKKKEEKKQ